MPDRKWVRSPLWDGMWLLSGIPLGVCFVLASLWLPSRICRTEPLRFLPGAIHHTPCSFVIAAWITVYSIVLLDTAHNISPMALAWSHDGFRAHMLRNPLKFAVTPLLLLIGGVAAGVASIRWFPHWQPFVSSDPAYGNSVLWPAAMIRHPPLIDPFWWLIVVYLTWNFYHFAKQNFGVLQIYKIKSGAEYPKNQRRIDLAFCFAAQSAVSGAIIIPIFVHTLIPLQTMTLFYLLSAAALVAMVVRDAAISGRWWTPRIMFAMSQALCFLSPGLLMMAANSVNHWLIAIGLASHVDGRTHNRSPLIFAVIVILLGIALFWALFWKAGTPWSWNLRTMIDLALPYAGFRLALGFVHFRYDRDLYRFSSSQVRETIGAALLA